jgi:hypothetical protein
MVSERPSPAPLPTEVFSSKEQLFDRLVYCFAVSVASVVAS